MELPICPTCGRPLKDVESEQQTVREPDETGLFTVTKRTGVWDYFCGGCFGDIPQELFQQVAEIVWNNRRRGVYGAYDPDPLSRQTLLAGVPGESDDHYWRRVSRATRRIPVNPHDARF